MKKLYSEPLFLLGLAIRLTLIFIMAPVAMGDWYVPFLDASTSVFTLDPWSIWLKGGGTLVAFPYGYAMWLVFLPLTIAAKTIGFPLQYGYGLTLLAADFMLLLVLRQLRPGSDRLLLVAYWLSPIVILASYGWGLNDLVPVVLLTLSLYFTQRLRLRLAGLACIAAISAKLSMALALPFFFIYLYNNRAVRQLLPHFLTGLLAGGMVLGLPFIVSASGLQMVFSNPEMAKVYSLALNLGEDIYIYIVPLVYSVMLYLVWRVRRLNYELFHATLGIAFLLVVLMTPSSPGWFIWALPLLVTYQAKSGRIAIMLTTIFSGLYVLSTLLATPLRFINIKGLGAINAFDFSQQFSDHAASHAASLLHTIMVAAGIVLAMRIWRETISRNDYFRLSRKPFVIGIAGDSGAGKDTFSDAMKGLFGEHSVATLSGDDYHLWDRQRPMWQVMTHLNPITNDLERFSNDLVSLTDGKSIQARHYDHNSGKMSRPFRIKPNDFILVSGLHALYLPVLRDRYNLSVYLDIDEDLRRHFKIARDVHQRGHTLDRVLASFERREPDSAHFIRPQAVYADLVLSLQPLHPINIWNETQSLRFKLVARSRHGLNELSVTRVLIGVCGLHVDMGVNTDGSEVVLTIEGDASADDIELAAKMLCPRILEFLAIHPHWQGGSVGLMQLITLAHANQALTKRFL